MVPVNVTGEQNTEGGRGHRQSRAKEYIKRTTDSFRTKIAFSMANERVTQDVAISQSHAISNSTVKAGVG